jgi:c-di-GMP-binding flagellar brake protein YcgR
MGVVNKERRRHNRYDYKTRIWLLQNGGAEPVAMTTANLSAGGLMIETEKKLPLDSNIKISIEYPFFSAKVTAIGRVVHIAEGSLGGRTRYGIQLVAVEGVTEEQLERFLSNILG